MPLSTRLYRGSFLAFGFTTKPSRIASWRVFIVQYWHHILYICPMSVYCTSVTNYKRVVRGLPFSYQRSSAQSNMAQFFSYEINFSTNRSTLPFRFLFFYFSVYLMLLFHHPHRRSQQAICTNNDDQKFTKLLAMMRVAVGRWER